MRNVHIAIVAVIGLLCCEYTVAQHHPANPRANFHAGIHSGSWTLKRSQLLEAESKDPHRSCADPYCARCSKHLATYGHEYQYIGGPSQRQLWYRGTAGTIAPVTQRGYDQHGFPYQRRGKPAAVMSWEYVQVLNHAIWEQVNARNAVAAEEAAGDRVVLLTQLLNDANEQLRLTKEAWEAVEPMEYDLSQPMSPCSTANVKGKTATHRCTKTYKQFCAEMRGGRYDAAVKGYCSYCLAHARYHFDLAYVAEVQKELALAQCDYVRKSARASELVRIALLSKEDADKATRFARLQHKPPKYKEIIAAMEAEAMLEATELESMEETMESEIVEVTTVVETQ